MLSNHQGTKRSFHSLLFRLLLFLCDLMMAVASQWHGIMIQNEHNGNPSISLTHRIIISSQTPIASSFDTNCTFTSSQFIYALMHCSVSVIFSQNVLRMNTKFFISILKYNITIYEHFIFVIL